MLDYRLGTDRNSPFTYLYFVSNTLAFVILIIYVRSSYHIDNKRSEFICTYTYILSRLSRGRDHWTCNRIHDVTKRDLYLENFEEFLLCHYIEDT